MTYTGHPDQKYGPTTFSQHGEDLMLLNLFTLLGIKPGNALAWLDLGAHHPEVISNTKLLYERGYRGVNVDANPNAIAAFQSQRPDDINLPVGIAPDKDGYADFIMFDDFSGRNTFDETEAQRFSAESKMPIKERVRIPVVTIATVIDRVCGGIFPPLLSCDLEGLDYSVLAATEFQEMRPAIICVETRPADTLKMQALLSRKKYILYCRCGENLIFVREALANAAYGY